MNLQPHPFPQARERSDGSPLFNHPAGHAYCVWETEGNIYGYDRNAGAFPIPVYTRDARAIAIVLAQELGKVLNENLAVDRAEFVESKHADLYRF